jgi:hypothetical protein
MEVDQGVAMEDDVQNPDSVLLVGDEIRGITKRNILVWQLFRHLARGDFRHDFNERVNTRDLITAGDENRFFDIAKRISKKGDVWLRTNFKKYINETIFTILQGSFDRILLPPLEGSSTTQEFFDEPELLKKIGINYEKLKEDVRKLEPGAAIQEKFVIPEVIERSYTIRSSSYRLGEKGSTGYSQNRNVAQMFREVTGDKKKFALIVDASGGLPLTEILNTSQQKDDALGGEEFYIIENIENSSDSATKLTNIKKSAGGNPPSLFFLKDKENTVVYPLWDNQQDPKSNIYASLKIVLNRISDDEVEANIIRVDAEGNTLQTFNIGDVANSSNVKNATLAALAVFIDQGIVPESFVYTLIKRMGDWCQALSMLDLDRVYSILNQDRQFVKEITLRDMLVDTEIGVVTNDRILLAFCILHGLNVFFTSAMDLARLIYFKNNNDLPAGDELDKRSAKLYEDAKVLPPKPDIETRIANASKALLEETELPAYISKLRNFMSNVGRLRNEYESLAKQYNDSKQLYEKTEGIKRFNAANAMVSTVAKIELDIQYNQKTISDLLTQEYPGSPRDTIRIDALRRKLASGARITKSVEIVEAKEILLSVRDDLKQVIAKNNAPNLSALIRTNFTPPTDRSQVNYDEILSVIPALRILLPAPQQGGGNVEKVYRAIRTRSIRVIPNDVNESTSTVNLYKQGSSFIDEKLNAYTVADEFIVTKDDLKVIESIFKDPRQTPNTKYICRKYLLLVCDIQLNLLYSFKGEVKPIETGDDAGILEDGTIQQDKVARFMNRSLQLEEAIKKNPIVGAMDVYKNVLVSTREDEEIPEIEQRLKSIRNSLIQSFTLNAEEQPVTLQLERIASDKYEETKLHAGRYREEIVQRLLGTLTNTTEEERLELGNAIENALQGSILDVVNSNEEEGYIATTVSEDAEFIAKKAAQAVARWASVRRPNKNIESTLQSVRTYATEIRRNELSLKRSLEPEEDAGPPSVKRTKMGTNELKRPLEPEEEKMTEEGEEPPSAKRTRMGGRRPLYSRHKTYRRKPRSKKTRKQ